MTSDTPSSAPGGPPPGGDLLATSQAGPAAVRGGVLRVGGYLVAAAFSVVSAALLFRHLGVGDAGRYVTITTLVIVFTGLTEAGLWGVAVRELSAPPDKRREELMRDLMGLRIALSAVAALGAVAFAAAAGYGSPLVLGTLVFGVGTVLGSLQLMLSAALAAKLRYGWMTAMDLVRQLVTVALIVAFVLLDGELLSFLAISVPAALAALVPTVVLVRGDMPMMPRFERAVWVDLLREVLPFAAATAVAVSYFRVALVLMSLIASEQQTGYFSASFRVIEVLLLVPALIVGSALPIFARAAADDPDRLRFGVQRVLDTTVILGVLVSLGVFVGAPGIIDIVAGSSFEPAAGVLRVQSIGLLAAFVSTVWTFALLSLGRYRAILVLTSVPLLLNVALTAALAPSEGATGAAIATAVGESVLAIAGGVVLMRAMSPRRISVTPVIRALAVGLPCAALALVDGVSSIALAVASGALFLVAIWAVRGIPPNLLADVRGGGGTR